MNCADYQNQIVHLILGELGVAEENAISEHLQQCQVCEAETVRVREILGLVELSASAETADSFRRGVSDRVLDLESSEAIEIMRSSPVRERLQAHASWIGYRVRSSTALKVILSAAAVNLIGLLVYLVWSGSQPAVQIPQSNVARSSPATGGVSTEDDVESSGVSALTEESDPTSSTVEDLVLLTPPTPEEVEPPAFPPPELEELEPLPFESLREARERAERENRLLRYRYLIRNRFQERPGTPIDRAVRLSLRWLADNQEDDGSWDPGAFGGEPEGRVGVTALCTLAMLVNAERGVPGGIHRRSVESAIAFLESQSLEDGTIGAVRGADDVLLFNHSLATLALVESWAMGAFEKSSRLDREQSENLLGEALVRLDDLRRWRSFWNSQSATDITAPWVALCLETARAAGAPTVVNLDRSADEATEQVARLVELDEHTGLPLNPSGQSYAMASVSALDTLFNDDVDWESYRPPLDLLLTHVRVESLREPSKTFFSALDIYQRSGAEWQRWRNEAESVILGFQNDDGSWSADYEWAHVQSMGGDLYQTAVMVLALSVEQRVAR